MESFPVQVSVSVRGNLADGCTELEVIMSRRDGETFELDIQTSHSGQEVCTEMAPLFEETVPLDVEGLPAGTYTVKVGDKTSTFTLDMDNGAVSTTNASDVTITLERTACHGTCPIYKLAIYGDGTVEYEGIDFVEVEGKQSSNIGANAVSELVGAFVDAGYFDWNDAYNEYYITDMPSAITSITLDGEQKQIEHYAGDESAPEALMKLEELIDSVANSAQWIGNGKAPLPTGVTLEGTTWLFSWGELDGESFSSFAGIPITLDFAAEQISGNASCNNFFGSYVVEGDNLIISAIGATRRACTPEISELEMKFLTALESVQSFSHDPDSLTLTLPNGALHFSTNMPVEKILFVGAEQVDCQGVAPQKCYLVKEEPNAEWEYFYDEIAGFQWEAGYEYELRVRVIPVENPPADASSVIYELIEVVSQSATQ
jgi:heat shock protein HslJ